MSAYLVDQISAAQNVEIHPEHEASAFLGTDHFEGARFSNPGGEAEFELAATFAFIGQQPRTTWLEGTLARDERGFVLTGADLPGQPATSTARGPYLLESSLAGVFAVGDVRHQSVKRIASAVGEGSMAVQFVHQYLANL
jgi:thioredoxin reductase (NADPH)